MRTDFELFDGAALSWFVWIGVFHALVQKGNQSPDEKLAILRRHLRAGASTSSAAWEEESKHTKRHSNDCGLPAGDEM